MLLDAPDQTLYVADEIDDDLSVINPTRCNAQDTDGCRPVPPGVTVGATEGDVADPAVDTVYAVSVNGPVTMIDTRLCNAPQPAGCARPPAMFTAGDFAPGTGPFAAAIDPITHTLYLANNGTGSDGTVTVIDDRTCNATIQSGCGSTATLDVPTGYPNAVVVDPQTDTLYVSSDAAGRPAPASLRL
ncbi:MAG: hypothetical protein ACLP50_18090 [Solirubrobacteraceae bacterium]